MADARRVPSDILRDVDELVLDYLVFKATKILLDAYEPAANVRKRKRTKSKPDTLVTDIDNHLQMVCSFLTMFRLHHPHYAQETTISPHPVHNQPYEHSPNPVSFRLNLLQFSTLFTLRHRPECKNLPSSDSLQKLRKSNRSRADRWKSISSWDEAYDVGSLPPGVYDGSKILDLFEAETTDSGQTSHSEPETAGPKQRSNTRPQEPNVPSLADVLPLFVKLTVSRARVHLASPPAHQPIAFDWTAQKAWLDLTGEFMLQAALEQRILYHDHGRDIFDECFAWGPRVDLSNHRQYGASSSEKDQRPQPEQLGGIETHSGSAALLQAENHEHDNLNEIFREGRSEVSPPSDSDELSSRRTAEYWLHVRARALTGYPAYEQAYKHTLHASYPPENNGCDKDPNSTRSDMRAIGSKYKQPGTAPHGKDGSDHHFASNRGLHDRSIRFHNDVRGFLQALLQSLEKPVLVQLEEFEAAGAGRPGTKLQVCGMQLSEEDSARLRLIWEGVKDGALLKG